MRLVDAPIQGPDRPVATTSSDSQYGGEVPHSEEIRIKITGLFVR